MSEEQKNDLLDEMDDQEEETNAEGEGETAGEQADAEDPTPPVTPEPPVAPFVPPVQPVAAAPAAPAMPGNLSGAPLPQPESDRDFGITYGKRQAQVKERLSKQPKVAFMIPRNPTEIEGLAYETVQIDGHRMEIKKGVMVYLPQQVAEILAEKYSVELNAGNSMKLGRSQDVTDALS